MIKYYIALIVLSSMLIVIAIPIIFAIIHLFYDKVINLFLCEVCNKFKGSRRKLCKECMAKEHIKDIARFG